MVGLDDCLVGARRNKLCQIASQFAYLACSLLLSFLL